MEFFPRPDHKNLRARAEKEDSGLHTENLYDQNEDAGGESTDLATGRPFDNTRIESIEEQLSTTEPGATDALPPLPDDDDAAARWLREHDK